MKTDAEKLKLLGAIFEDYIVAVEKARLEALARYHIDVLGFRPNQINEEEEMAYRGRPK